MIRSRPSFQVPMLVGKILWAAIIVLILLCMLYHHTVDRIVMSFENLLACSSRYFPYPHLSIVASCEHCMRRDDMAATLTLEISNKNDAYAQNYH